MISATINILGTVLNAWTWVHTDDVGIERFAVHETIQAYVSEECAMPSTTENKGNLQQVSKQLDPRMCGNQSSRSPSRYFLPHFSLNFTLT